MLKISSPLPEYKGQPLKHHSQAELSSTTSRSLFPFFSISFILNFRISFFFLHWISLASLSCCWLFHTQFFFSSLIYSHRNEDKIHHLSSLLISTTHYIPLFLQTNLMILLRRWPAASWRISPFENDAKSHVERSREVKFVKRMEKYLLAMVDDEFYSFFCFVFGSSHEMISTEWNLLCINLPPLISRRSSTSKLADALNVDRRLFSATNKILKRSKEWLRHEKCFHEAKQTRSEMTEKPFVVDVSKWPRIGSLW